MATNPQYGHDLPTRRLAQPVGDTSRTTEGPSAIQWEAHKDEIRVLYELGPLKEVKKALEARGFVATERMYKSRLHSWGFNKNSSDKEYQVAIILHNRRKEAGKHDSVFIINGNRRSLKDLRKYIKGRKISDDQFLSTAQENDDAGQLTEFRTHVRCETPDPEEADSKQSPASAKTPSTSGSSPPQKQAVPVSIPSPSPFAPAFMKREASDEYSASQHPIPSHSPVHRSHARQRSSNLTRNKKHSFSTSRPSIDRPPMDLSPMDGVQFSSCDMPSDKLIYSAFDMTSERPLKSGYDTPTDSPHHGSIVAQTKTKTGTPKRHHAEGHSPSCEHFTENDVETLAHSAVYSNALGSSYGLRNMSALRMLNPPSDDGFEIVCGKCLSPHFSSLQHVNNSPPSTSYLGQYAAEQSPARAILNPSTEVPADSFKIAPSAKEHDYCFKWVSRCFLACIHLTKHAANPHDSRSAEVAEFMLREADQILEQMLKSDDHKIALTLNHAVTILSMHNQELIAERIMKRTAAVAERIVGLSHPIGVIARFLGYAVIPRKLREQTEITSVLLRHVWNHCVMTYETREKDLRSIGAMYCLGYMLNVESFRDKEHDKLIESESIMRQCYQLSCERLSKRHLQSIMALTNLRLNMERQGRMDEAIAYAETAIYDSLDTLGSQHPKRLELMRNLGISYEQQGRDADAEKLYWQVLEGRISMLGRSHAFTQGAKRDLIKFLDDRCRWVEEVDGGCAEQQRIDDLFSWSFVDNDDPEDDPAEGMAATKRQLKAY